MNETDPLSPDDALDDGDITEQILAEYGPYLRMVVRRRMNDGLRSKFDSEDVLQSVWIHLLSRFRKGGWQLKSTQELRSFLWRVTSNRMTDRIRRSRGALSHEVPTDGAALDEVPATDPTASQSAQVTDLWERLQALCPPQHVRILEMRRQGAGYREIAERFHLHESSVRRIIYDLARRLGRADEAGESATIGGPPRA